MSFLLHTSSLMSGVWKRSSVDETEPPRHTSTLLFTLSTGRGTDLLRFGGRPFRRTVCSDVERTGMRHFPR
jgi:hypothetical protein